MTNHPFAIPRHHAIGDGRGSGALRKPTAKQRAIAALEKAIDKDAKAEERLAAARRKAIGESFDAWIAGADAALVTEVFAGLEVAATKADRKRIASHPLRPAEVDAIVEARLAEIERIKAEDAADRAGESAEDKAEHERKRPEDETASDAA